MDSKDLLAQAPTGSTLTISAQRAGPSPGQPAGHLVIEVGGKEVMRFEPNGDIFVRGRRTATDLEVVEGVRGLLLSARDRFNPLTATYVIADTINDSPLRSYWTGSSWSLDPRRAATYGMHEAESDCGNLRRFSGRDAWIVVRP
jgi:hypothetical protein